ncbi:hypothetical protein A2707_00935 [Candidatus Saccharibacteria bacterium RIFCSPHIGHO2_01_FULL_45_15]|nr:MAG: hypothetical protein A2707_00935 [Candidatus Saccharibacteria bacterium RIFCSPHIGHO2_01_FULL_45_15]OGL26937.1 MAG: hypothetical protein A3C39_02050 [Candidatus Saccharibacteria bacterium RIFCSPHIGHO2_02_FULL_46_12]OGL32290.1 MAG: hypothetical protein A3E76_02755 [Candidatus Saccharibacteria bacterium RIFCSPHIGHO2_12_FULL_44_22]
MMHRFDAPRHDVSNSYIPEREFWTDEAAETYLDDNGNLKTTKTGEFDFELRTVPLVDPDTRPVVDIPALAFDLKSLFKPGYRFPRRYRKHYIDANGFESSMIRRYDDNVDHTQEVKLHKKAGSLNPEGFFAFCDNPERKMKEPQLIHVVKTNIYADTIVPDLSYSKDHLRGANLSLALYRAALLTDQTGRGFGIRRQSIQSGAVVPGSEIDPRSNIDKDTHEHLASLHRKYIYAFEWHKENYMAYTPDTTIFADHKEIIAQSHPKNIARILAHVATSEPWDYGPYFRHNIEPADINKRRKNTYKRRVATAEKLRVA